MYPDYPGRAPPTKRRARKKIKPGARVSPRSRGRAVMSIDGWAIEG